MKNAIYFIYLLLPLIVSSCSNDEPQPEVFMQVASITDENGSISQQISYDSYGRVIAYKSYSTDVSVNGIKMAMDGKTIILGLGRIFITGTMEIL